ncbi:hypothetical protein [Bradyrhizobium sp. ARR65]|uniref:hypothetical protein n=1 Tax=Bradyrhizobium sp. ARR65 TaxID=1040989 RepID=UPI001FD9A693|nr:hypothetical protein [Bradyrhizobium sp. ARR65]
MPTAEIMQLPLHSRAPRRTLWSRLREIVLAFGTTCVGRRNEYAASAAFGHSAQSDTPERCGTAVLPFPIRGEAVLVRLAHTLRSRFGDADQDGDPLLLTIARGAQCRLTIDQAAYVEFCREWPGFHVAIEAAPSTTVSLKTADFDIVVGFVLHYLGEKLGTPAMLEAAS